MVYASPERLAGRQTLGLCEALWHSPYPLYEVNFAFLRDLGQFLREFAKSSGLNVTAD